MTFFIVFDTCTHARYYGDVHEVLALPESAVIRYEYKRYLYSAAAAAAIEMLARDPTRLPVPALLMYGQKKRFSQGDAEPQTMLTRADSEFVPTRSADLMAVAVERSADRDSDVLYMHFQLRGFVTPDAPIIGELVAALEAANSLPFGDKQTQYTWISLLPGSLAPKQSQLVSDDQTLWSMVVDRLIALATQFENDVFWRVKGLVQITNGQPGPKMPLKDRRTNKRVHSDSWRRDYGLFEAKRYAVAIQTHSPEGHGVAVPAGSSIAMTSLDDDDKVLGLSSDPLQIVPNQVEYKRFKISISNDAAFDTRYTGIRLETQLQNHASAYPLGSMCSLTFSVRKELWRLVFGLISLCVRAGFLAIVAVGKPNLWWGVTLTIVAALLGWCGYYLIFKQFKFGK